MSSHTKKPSVNECNENLNEKVILSEIKKGIILALLKKRRRAILKAHCGAYAFILKADKD